MTYRTFNGEAKRGRRRGVAHALSSVILKIAAIPLVATSVALSIYVRTSPYPPTEALVHLIAMGGCPAAAFFGLSNRREGELGYHKRNDPDGDGIACAASRIPGALVDGAEPDITHRAGGAKFVRAKGSGG